MSTHNKSRRAFIGNGAIAGASLWFDIPNSLIGRESSRQPWSGKNLGTIMNNDIDNLLWACPGKETTPLIYRQAVEYLLDAQPSLLAQNVGMPDPVIYRSRVATTIDKYMVSAASVVHSPDIVMEEIERQAATMAQLLGHDTDPLTITVKACRERSIPIVASYRMNAEDWYNGTLLWSDFGRVHPHWAIVEANCMDPAIPGVYEHRMRIFREVVEEYDVDGIEFDFMRWYHMVSDPHRNYPVLTRMVRDSRQMLNETARQKRKSKLILGVRVPRTLKGGSSRKPDLNCHDLGVDVATWIRQGLVDYVCPSWFGEKNSRLPQVEEFATLAQGTQVGIYPTLMPLTEWTEGAPENLQSQRRLRDHYCQAALKMYERGADGISTYNWWPHQQTGKVSVPFSQSARLRIDFHKSDELCQVQYHVHPRLKSPQQIRECLQHEPW